ncbi:MAG: hypothetical protein H7A12_07330 [Pseudomonadales bacterium]|jgi:hypothetical protein|nr:hypothetical protein [Pseudomonadales bacterium]MCP5320622.1 hypothetical protein [Pseudomonadales bacterium]MCP5336633.1 hypothetical protein [Pseudomonadales bacterium]
MSICLRGFADTRALKRLSSASMFAQARISEHGTAVIWIDDELDLGTDNLHNLAVEQAGGIGHERDLVPAPPGPDNERPQFRLTRRHA